MSRWFRFYDDAVNDPKIIKLSDDIFRAWVNLLCIASKNEGVFPAVDDIAIILRVKIARAAAIIAELVSFGLLDKTETGFAPHNWNGRQYKSDVSTERVKRFRNGQRNVSETETKRPQIQSTDTEQKEDIRTVADATRPDVDFEEFWKAKPRRSGADPKMPAAKLFRAAVKAGTPAQVIIDGARRWAVADASKAGTEFLPQAVKWLRDKRWLDYPAFSPEPEADTDWEAICASYKKLGIWSKHAPGNHPDSGSCLCPPEILARHGISIAKPLRDQPLAPLLRSM